MNKIKKAIIVFLVLISLTSASTGHTADNMMRKSNASDDILKNMIRPENCIRNIALTASDARREILEDMLKIVRQVNDPKVLVEIIKQKIENNRETKKCLEESQYTQTMISCKDERIKRDEAINKAYKVSSK